MFLGSLPFNFVDGVTEVIATENDMPKLAHVLAINWQAFPEGDPRIEETNNGFRNLQTDSTGALPGNNEPNGDRVNPEAPTDSNPTASAETGAAQELPNGDGQQAGVNDKLARAVQSLDPSDDSLWTANGQPTIKAVEVAYGSTGITREDITQAAPGFTRKTAQSTQG